MGRRGPDKKPRKGRSDRKFTPDVIRAIRAEFAETREVNAIATKYGVCRSQVYAITSRRYYSDVE